MSWRSRLPREPRFNCRSLAGWDGGMTPEGSVVAEREGARCV